MTADVIDIPPREGRCLCRRLRDGEASNFATALQAVNATEQTALLLHWRAYGVARARLVIVRHHAGEHMPKTERGAMRYLARCRYWYTLTDRAARPCHGRAA